MKTFAAFFLIAALGLATILSLPRSSAQERTVVPAGAAVPGAPEVAPVVIVGSWELIKDFTYAQRADFVAILSRMIDKVDQDILQLNVKRNTLTEDAARDWDLAMKDLEEARSLLQSKLTELNNARPEAWAAAKDQIANAWQRVQDAFDKVRTSTTS